MERSAVNDVTKLVRAYMEENQEEEGHDPATRNDCVRICRPASPEEPPPRTRGPSPCRRRPRHAFLVVKFGVVMGLWREVSRTAERKVSNLGTRRPRARVRRTTSRALLHGHARLGHFIKYFTGTRKLVRYMYSPFKTPIAST
jgi:hypothetical protein